MDLNRVTLLGRLTHDPEVRTIPNGRAVATFSLATSRFYQDASKARHKQVNFNRLVAWGKLAETVGEYLHKGSRLYAEGRLQNSDWAGPDGVKRYRTEVVLEQMIMLDRKPATSAPGGGAEMAEVVSVGGDEAVPEVLEEEVKVEAIPF